MLESEAKNNWCPYANVIAQRKNNECVPLGNRALHTEEDVVSVGFNHSTCLASRCMAWRWINPPIHEGQVMKNPSGYCGLAGKP